MTTQTNIKGQKSSPADSPEGPINLHDTPSSPVSSRRLKKREVDRRCQRQARERTKSRIAYLEGLVEDFRRQDSSGQVATLMEQLKEVEAERDVMAKALKDIQKAMEGTKPPKPPDTPTHEPGKPSVAGPPYRADDSDRRPHKHAASDDAGFVCGRELRAPSVEVKPPVSFDMSHFSPAPDMPLLKQDRLFAPEIVCLGSHRPAAMGQALVQSKDVRDDNNPMPSTWADNWANPRHSCSCHGCHRRQPGQKSIWRGNYWRYANEVLSERFNWSQEVEPANDAVSDDVPIRAILDGWDAVAKCAPLHPSWQILRRIDQSLFSTCPDTERLAILRAMHMLLQFHTEPNTVRYGRLPPWYMRRPSQKIAHSYAIDFFAWPGLRERFIFSEHDYCGNEFWHLFSNSVQILWPYEFRDCYTREIDTGLYKISPLFDERLSDIKCWTMGPDLFQRFPELYSDIPAFNQVPQVLSPRDRSPLPNRLLCAAPAPETAKKPPRQIVEEVEEDPVSAPPPAGTVFMSIGNPMPPTHAMCFGEAMPPPMPVPVPVPVSDQYRPAPPSAQPYTFADFVPVDDLVYASIGEADFSDIYQTDLVGGSYQNAIF